MREKLEALVRQAGVNCITLTLGDASKPLDDYESILSSIDWWERFLESFDLFSQVRTEAEIEAVYSEGKISLFFALQDLGCIGNEILRLEALYDRGVRIGQLTYNGANSIGSGCAVPTDGGLTEFGKKAIREMNRLGIAVDLSHCGPVTTLE